MVGMVFNLEPRRGELPFRAAFVQSTVAELPLPWLLAQRDWLALNGWLHKEHDTRGPVLDLAWSIPN